MTVRALRDATTPVTLELARRDTGHDGNLEGLYLEGITLGDDWVYRNPFVPARPAGPDGRERHDVDRSLQVLPQHTGSQHGPARQARKGRLAGQRRRWNSR